MSEKEAIEQLLTHLQKSGELAIAQRRPGRFVPQRWIGFFVGSHAGQQGQAGEGISFLLVMFR